MEASKNSSSSSSSNLMRDSLDLTERRTKKFARNGIWNRDRVAVVLEVGFDFKYVVVHLLPQDEYICKRKIETSRYYCNYRMLKDHLYVVLPTSTTKLAAYMHPPTERLEMEEVSHAPHCKLHSNCLIVL